MPILAPKKRLSPRFLQVAFAFLQVAFVRCTMGFQAFSGLAVEPSKTRFGGPLVENGPSKTVSQVAFSKGGAKATCKASCKIWQQKQQHRSVASRFSLISLR